MKSLVLGLALPPGDPHVEEMRDSDVVLQITGFGPTGTTY